MHRSEQASRIAASQLLASMCRIAVARACMTMCHHRAARHATCDDVVIIMRMYISSVYKFITVLRTHSLHNTV